MSGRSIIIAIFAVLAVAAASVPAMAGEESGIETVYGMDPFYIEFENTGSDEMKVTWDIELTDGVPINVVLLDEENRERYPGLAYEAYKGHEYSYVNGSKRTVKVEEGKYYLAIESAHSSMDSSTVDYDVRWDEDAGGGIFWAPWCWPVLIILVLVFGVGILFLLWRMFGGGGHAALGPRTDVAPAPGTGEVAELSPQPEPPDIPEGGGEAGEGSAHEPPAPGVTTLYGPDTTATQLSPQPEPPSAPSSTEMVRPTGEGATQLSPQPEPPDMPASSEMVRPTGEGATELSPQPEPPDMPASSEMVRPTGEGATGLSPQPEPPDMPADAYKPPVEGSTELGPQPEPPDQPPGTRKPPDLGGEGP